MNQLLADEEHRREKRLLQLQVEQLQALLDEQTRREQTSKAFYSSVLAEINKFKAAPPQCENCLSQQDLRAEAGRAKCEEKRLRERVSQLEREDRENRIRYERHVLRLEGELSETQFQNKELMRKLSSSLDELLTMRSVADSQRRQREQLERPSVGRKEGSFQELKVMVGALLKAKSKLEEGSEEITSLQEMSRISGL